VSSLKIIIYSTEARFKKCYSAYLNFVHFLARMVTWYRIAPYVSVHNVGIITPVGRLVSQPYLELEGTLLFRTRGLCRIN
jgi:uncharacterized membrane protein